MIEVLIIVLIMLNILTLGIAISVLAIVLNVIKRLDVIIKEQKRVGEFYG